MLLYHATDGKGRFAISSETRATIRRWSLPEICWWTRVLRFDPTVTCSDVTRMLKFFRHIPFKFLLTGRSAGIGRIQLPVIRCGLHSTPSVF